MIPKLVHRIWFGPDAVPLDYEKFWLAWQRQHPDYTFKTWRDSDIDGSFLTCGKIREADSWVRKADIARYEILYKHGGVYLDCDVMPYHRLDWQKLNTNLAVCNEVDSDEFCSIGVIAAGPGTKILEQAIATIVNTALNRQPPNVETGPFFFRRMLNGGPYVKFRKEAFYPYAFNEPFAAILEKDLTNTYGIHIWRGSWIQQEEMVQNILDRLRWGDLTEAAALASEAVPETRQLVTEHVDAVRKARTSCLAAAGNGILSKYLKIRATSYFEFLKCAFHLVAKNKDTVIWQIGAADGIFSDPLRPLAIGSDPPIVMLEPNPHMFERLKANYARNQRSMFIQAALGSSPGKLGLNVVSPDKIAENNLPGWVAGISSFYRDRNAVGGLTIDTDTAARIEQCLEKITVDVMTVPQLLAATDNRAPGIVLVDAEGMDGEIVRSIFSSGIRPLILQYETQCLPKPEQEALASQLGKDYVLLTFGNDLVAYRTDFFLSYCNDLYIKHGIPTIYEDALKFILKA
jgi:FkbM family methyltransferase